MKVANIVFFSTSEMHDGSHEFGLSESTHFSQKAARSLFFKEVCLEAAV